jgi:hypothetical protein
VIYLDVRRLIRGEWKKEYDTPNPKKLGQRYEEEEIC